MVSVPSVLVIVAMVIVEKIDIALIPLVISVDK